MKTMKTINPRKNFVGKPLIIKKVKSKQNNMKAKVKVIHLIRDQIHQLHSHLLLRNLQFLLINSIHLLLNIVRILRHNLNNNNRIIHLLIYRNQIRMDLVLIYILIIIRIIIYMLHKIHHLHERKKEMLNIIHNLHRKRKRIQSRNKINNHLLFNRMIITNKQTKLKANQVNLNPRSNNYPKVKLKQKIKIYQANRQLLNKLLHKIIFQNKTVKINQTLTQIKHQELLILQNNLISVQM